MNRPRIQGNWQFRGATMSRPACMMLTLSCFFVAGCAGARHAQPTIPAAPIAVLEEAPERAVQRAEVATTVAEVPVPPAPLPPTQPVHPVEPAPAARVAVPNVPAKIAPVTTVASPKPSPRPPSKPVAVVPAATVPPPRVLPKVAAVPPVAPQLTPAPLDFKALASRLRETKAIGMLTKLALKNEVDDLVDRFRAYHKRQGTTTLAELRRNYDMLLLKVLSLLQDSDPPLARDIVKSRAAIWSVLEDPGKFTESNLMAGATP